MLLPFVAIFRYFSVTPGGSVGFMRSPTHPKICPSRETGILASQDLTGDPGKKRASRSLGPTRDGKEPLRKPRIMPSVFLRQRGQPKGH